MGTTPDLGIPELSQAQANPDITHNEALISFQALLNGVVDKDLTAPPGSPVEGDSYIINTAAPTGAWTGHARQIAIYWGAAWRFVPGRDDAGAIIAMGVRHEGIRLYVRDEDLFYTWTGAAWSSTAVSAATVANTPAGGIAATNVQAAINELDTEKVAKAGDTMTGLLTVVATGGIGVGSGNLNLQSNDAGNLGPTLVSYHNSPSPAVNDNIAFHVYAGKNSAAADTSYGWFLMNLSDVTSGSEDASFLYYTRKAGTLGQSLEIGNGLLIGAATGGTQGNGTINAVNYFDDGVNINLIYAGLASPNNFTQPQTIAATVTAARGSAQLILQSNDAGVIGVSLEAYHNSASPAANDYLLLIQAFGKDSGAADQLYTQQYSQITNAAAGAEAAIIAFNTVQAGTVGGRFNIGAGLWVTGATGGDQGANSINLNALYMNGVQAVDNNALLRTRTFTVATLPAPAGIAGAIARVSDSLVAPVYNAVAAGGGTTFAIVTSDGTNWRYA